MPHRPPPPNETSAHLETLQGPATAPERERAVKRLLQAPPAALDDILPELEKLARRGFEDNISRFTLRDLLSVIAKVGGNAAFTTLTALFEQATDLGHRNAQVEVVRAFEELGDERAIPLLAASLDDATFDSRKTAARALATLAQGTDAAPEIEEQLFEILMNDDEEEIVRRNAARGLGTLGNPAFKSDLWEVVTDESEREEVRAAAARAIGELGDESDVPRLATLIDNRRHTSSYTDDLGKESALALGEIGTPSAVQKLNQIVRRGTAPDTEWSNMSTCRAAMDALGTIGNANSIGALEGASGMTAYRNLAKLRLRLDPEAAIEQLPVYDSITYEEELATLLADHVAESRNDQLVWDYLQIASARGQTQLTRHLFDNTHELDEEFLVDLAWWVLDSDRERRESRLRKQLSALLDSPGRTVLDRILESDRERLRERSISIFRAHTNQYCLDLLGVFSDDTVVASELQKAALGKTTYEPTMALETLYEVAPKTAVSTAKQILKKERTDDLVVEAFNILRRNSDTQFESKLVDQFLTATAPDYVGGLTHQLLLAASIDPSSPDSPENPTVAGLSLYELFVSKLRDQSFYNELTAEYGGYDIDQPHWKSDDPRRLPACANLIDDERTATEVRQLVRSALSPEFRIDMIRIARTISADTPELLAEQLDDPDPRVRFVAGKALAADGEESAVALLGSVGRASPMPTAKRRAAIRYLRDIGTELAVKELVSIAQFTPSNVFDPDRQTVRSTAVNALGNISSERATEFLQTLAGRETDLAVASRHALDDSSK